MAPFSCEHGRNCVECPNKMLTAVTELMREAAQIFSDVHYSFDGITVKTVVTWSGSVEIRLKKVDDDNI